jgi:hypothetical protein
VFKLPFSTTLQKTDLRVYVVEKLRIRREEGSKLAALHCSSPLVTSLLARLKL